MPAVSVIVPVYNAHEYLTKCIESILAQTFTDFELILVDDGSTDGCGDICDSFVKLDRRIKCIHQENHGLSSARNQGLAVATGEKICFVDSDDWIDPDYLAVLGTVDADITVINFYRGDSTLVEQDYSSIHSSSDFVKALVEETVFGCVWNKCFRRSIIEKNRLRFDDSVDFGEDVLFISSLLVTGDYSIHHVDKACYHYITNMSSLSRKFNRESLFRRLHQFDKLENVVLPDGFSHSLNVLYNHIFWDSFRRGNVMVRADFNMFIKGKYDLNPRYFGCGRYGLFCFDIAKIGLFNLSQHLVAFL